MRVRKTVFNSGRCVRDFSSSKEFNSGRCVIEKRKRDFSSSKERKGKEICLVRQKKKKKKREICVCNREK